MPVTRSPCEVYLKFLLVHPERHSDDHIRGLVRMQGLDFIGKPYLQRIRSVCVPPIPFYPDDINHRPSYRFLRKERMELLFHPNEDMEAATFLLGEPRAKEVLESMLIARSEPAWVARNLRKVGYGVSADAVSQYKFHYFNVDMLDANELRALVMSRCVGDESADPDEQRLNAASIKAARYDSRVLTSQMQVGPLAAVINQVRMGVLPTNIELGRLISAARTVAVAGAMEAVMDRAPTPAREYALVAKLFTEVLEQVGVAEKDLQQGLSGLLLSTEQDAVTHIDALTAGEHTMDLQVIETAEEIDVDDSTDSPV